MQFQTTPTLDPCAPDFNTRLLALQRGQWITLAGSGFRSRVWGIAYGGRGSVWIDHHGRNFKTWAKRYRAAKATVRMMA